MSELIEGQAAAPAELTVWTIGHSTRPFPEFLALLSESRIEAIADVRRFPGSRRHPEYGSAVFEQALREHGLGYRWLPSLGGRRQPRPDSHNDAWRNASFRGYADHMETSEFAAGLAELLTLARERRTAVMCAEAMWWRCHRSLIADALCADGIRVVHILSPGHTTPHPMTSPARVVQGRLTYDAPSD